MARDGKKTGGRFDAAQAITDEIVALLEAGTLPWRQPWRIAGGGVPLRVGGEPYCGINAFLLGLRAAMTGHASPFWMMFDQAKALGTCVRRGEHSSAVVYYGTAGRKDGAGDGDVGGEGGEGRHGGASDAEAGGAYRLGSCVDGPVVVEIALGRYLVLRLGAGWESLRTFLGRSAPHRP